MVLDTNVVLSALLFGSGRLSALRVHWQAARMLPLVSKATVQELLRVLAYPKFRLTAAERNELLRRLPAVCRNSDCDRRVERFARVPRS